MWQRCSSLDMDTIPSVLAHGTGLSSATSLRVQAPVRTPPSNWLHEMATCRLFKTEGLNPQRRSAEESPAPCAKTEGMVSVSRLEHRCHINVDLQGLVQSAVL